MLDNNEIKNAVNMYETMKRDLHNHLVKKCESPLDYTGEFTVLPYCVTFEYPIKENKNREVHDMLLDMGVAIKNMLKTDIAIWGKTRGIKSLEVAPDPGCHEMIVEILYM